MSDEVERLTDAAQDLRWAINRLPGAMMYVDEQFAALDEAIATLAASDSGRLRDALTDEQIKRMANRFLGWRLPDDFNPDGGVSFCPVGNRGSKHEYRHNPTGTNLFDATQAEAMVRYMAEALKVQQ